MDQYAKEKIMNPYTVKYLKHAFFEKGEFEIEPSLEFNDREFEVDWNKPETINNKRTYDKGEGWYWDGKVNTSGISWGGCVESIDELLRHDIPIPSLEDFQDIVLFTETSEEKPTSEYAERVYRALGERGILSNIKALIVGRPASSFREKENTLEERMEYKRKQRETVLNIVRVYNKDIPIIQNFDIGHTVPQVCLPMGKMIRIDSDNKKIFAEF
jgi:muramoyltetrapeptide carboxypeptidase LdcA involved in peptidoglycan recycling